jgi:hypothetical protein
MRPQPDPAEKQLAERFRAALTPAPLEVDSPTLWFEAGRAAARAERSARGWQAYSVVSTAAAAMLAFVVVQQRETPSLADSAPSVSTIVMTEPADTPEPEAIAEPIATPTTPNAPSWALWFVAATPSPDSYLGRRDLVLREGIDALPEPPRVEGVYNASLPIEPPPTAARLLRMYLPAEKAAATKTEDPQADQSSSHSEKLA